jgi:predicted NBD/HSP70 family sugar kinase
MALNSFRTEDTLSRVALAQKLNCDGTSVTRITRDLIAKGVLKAGGLEKQSTRGRPRERIMLNADWKQAIGIELSPGHINGIVTDLKGRASIQKQVFISGSLTKEEFVDSLKTIVQRLLASCDREKLLGIGVAAFGAFSQKGNVLENVSAYPALKNFNIRKFFEDEFAITPEITDATFARALYEIWFTKGASKGSFLLFDAGSGIGCAPVLNGKIVFGKYPYTGEFGHTVCVPDGDLCNCGRRGCLETVCSIGMIEKKARAKESDPTIKFSTIAEDYASGGHRFADIVDNAARWLGIAVANQINFLVPDKVVLTGELLQLGDGFTKNCVDTIKEYILPVFMKDVTIRKSDAWYESATLGVASLLIGKVFEDIEYVQHT